MSTNRVLSEILSHVTGWVLCLNVLYPSADGSAASALAQKTVLDDAPPPTLLDVEFTNTEDGWLVGRIGIFKTSNGGKTWTKIGPSIAVSRNVGASALSILTPIFRLDFIDADKGWVQRSDGLLKTNDGGLTWQLISVLETRQQKAFQSFSFIEERHGWALDIDGSIYYTDDGGESWSRQASIAAGRAAKTVTANECWIVGSGGKLTHTTDAGGTWSTLFVGTDEDLLDVAVVDGRFLFVNSSRSVYQSLDSGKTWTLALRPGLGSPVINSVRFANPSMGWVVGDRGMILHTSDGGKTWSAQKSGVRTALKRISVIDGRAAWIIGDALMLKTVDGGKNWRRQKVPSL